MEHDEHIRPAIHLTLSASAELLPRFASLGGSGFRLRAATGCSLHDLLCGQLGIAADYIHGRIQTIFLNGTVVDDPQTAEVPDRAVIALSAALPGIAGMMLRKGSPYAAMRREISQGKDHDKPLTGGHGRVVLKLFNMLQPELGPLLLARGVQVSGNALARLLHGRSGAFLHGIVAAQIDGRPVDECTVLQTEWTELDVWLQVVAGSTR